MNMAFWEDETASMSVIPSNIGLPSFEGSENWRDKYRACCYQVLYILWNLHWSWSFTVPTSSGTRREVCGVSHLTNDMLCMLCMRITLIPEKKLWKQGCWWWWIVVVNGGPRQDSEGSHPTNEYFQLKGAINDLVGRWPSSKKTRPRMHPWRLI